MYLYVIHMPEYFLAADKVHKRSCECKCNISVYNRSVNPPLNNTDAVSHCQYLSFIISCLTHNLKKTKKNKQTSRHYFEEEVAHKHRSGVLM